MPDASPTKWHLAHVTWFFETFILERFEPGFRPFDPAFRVLFNSYYKGVGEQYPRPAARPGHAADAGRGEALSRRRRRADAGAARAHRGDAEIEALVTLGLQHEQQHQELLLTDIKHALSFNPAASGYARRWPMAQVRPQPLRWFGHEGGLVELGHDPAQDGDFCFDNETPRHRAYAEPFEIASRPATYGEFLAFIDDGGYAPARALAVDGLGLGAGRPAAAPLYWRRDGDRWLNHTLQGTVEIDPHTPVCHLSYFEADAFARWAGARLPTELEWEHRGAVAARAAERQLRRSRRLPSDAADRADRRRAGADVRRRLGMDASAYLPYPGYRPLAGRSANTTASSCATSSCCAAARAPRRRATCAPATATSSRRTRSGSSAACAWPATPEPRGPYGSGVEHAQHVGAELALVEDVDDAERSPP